MNMQLETAIAVLLLIVLLLLFVVYRLRKRLKEAKDQVSELGADLQDYVYASRIDAKVICDLKIENERLRQQNPSNYENKSISRGNHQSGGEPSV